MRISFFLILFLLFSYTLYSQNSAVDSASKKLEWVAVPGAEYYIVEIEKEAILIHTLETESNFIPLFLNPGEYRIRISAYNKFRKQASQSSWSPLTVFPSIQPVIEKLEPDIVLLDGEDFHLIVTGTDFDENSRFFLVYRDRVIEGQVSEKKQRNNKYEYGLTFSKTDLIPAEWDLFVENPSGKKYIKKEALRVERKSVPLMESLSQTLFYRNRNNGNITIRGERFSPKITLLLNGKENRALPRGDVFFEKEIVFQINTENLDPGTYEISVMNDTGLISNGLTIMIEDPPLTEKDRAIKERNESNFTLGLSYKFSFPLDKGSELFDISPAGLGIIIRSRFDNPSVYKIPVLRNIGFFTDLDATYLSLKKQGIYEDIIFTANVGLYYQSVFDTPLNFLVSAGLGPAYSFFILDDNQVKKSFDFCSNITLALLYRKDTILMEGGYNYSSIQYQFNSLTMIKPYFLYGWEF